MHMALLKEDSKNTQDSPDMLEQSKYSDDTNKMADANLFALNVANSNLSLFLHRAEKFSGQLSGSPRRGIYH